MLLNILFIAVALVLLYVGAEWLVRGSSNLALFFGVSPLVVGLTVVSIGTSSPEIFVSVGAALADKGDLAVGNVVGSNIFNVGVILGLTALVAPMRVQFQLLKIDAPIMLGVMFFVPVMLADGVVGRMEGTFLLGCLLCYLALNVIAARRTATPEVEAEYAESLPADKPSPWIPIVWILVGLGVLAGGARLLTTNAVELARLFGLSEAIIGLTIVAAGTSLPELAASVVAALKKEPDIAIGNIIGSNIFNVLGILGVAALVRPLHAPGISHFDVYAMIALSAALLPFLWTGLRLQRLEGAFLLLCYAGYLAVLWP